MAGHLQIRGGSLLEQGHVLTRAGACPYYSRGGSLLHWGRVLTTVGAGLPTAIVFLQRKVPMLTRWGPTHVAGVCARGGVKQLCETVGWGTAHLTS